MFQIKEQDKIPEKCNLPDKGPKAIVIKVLTELRKRIVEHGENFNKELENVKKSQSKLKNTIT